STKVHSVFARSRLFFIKIRFEGSARSSGGNSAYCSHSGSQERLIRIFVQFRLASRSSFAFQLLNRALFGGNELGRTLGSRFLGCSHLGNGLLFIGRFGRRWLLFAGACRRTFRGRFFLCFSRHRI